MTIVVDEPSNSMRSQDKFIIVMIAVFTSVAFSLELYWLIFNQVMESRTDLLARILALYWPADYTWRISGTPPQKALSISLETVNVFITPWLSLGLIWSIIKKRIYRFPLQLLIGTYTAYGTIIYYSVAHVSGYPLLEYKGVYPFLLFYLANFPWLVAYAWLTWDAFSELLKRLDGRLPSQRGDPVIPGLANRC